MIKRLLFSTLFMMIGYCCFGQGGQYLVILKEGYCNVTNIFSPNPSIITIDPSGNINETLLQQSNTFQDVLEHTAQFNVIVSNIINQGYTIAPIPQTETVIYAGAYSGNMNWSDAVCPGAYSAGIQVVTLIPCCTPP